MSRQMVTQSKAHHARPAVVSQLLNSGNTAADASGSQQEIRVISSLPLATANGHPHREKLIEEAAYHHAEARGFEPGHELDDWLLAEDEVDARLDGEGRAY